MFQNIDFNTEQLGNTKDRNRLLKTLLEDFANPRLDLRPSRIQEDIIGEAYMYLIERFGSDAGKKAGEFYTPSPVRRLVAKLAKPEPGNLICDPTCGSGHWRWIQRASCQTMSAACLVRKTAAHWHWRK